MHLDNHPELLDRLAASYALGTLRGPARRRLESYARQSAVVRTRMLLWQERLGTMTELVMPLAPSHNVWKRIEIALDQEMQMQRLASMAQSRESLLQTNVSQIAQLAKWLNRWRMGALAGALATVAAVGVGWQAYHNLDTQVAVLAQQISASQQTRVVAVLSDDKAQTAMLVSFNAANNSLILQRAGAYQEAADKSLQLWALPASGAPQSLGVLGSASVINLKASAEQLSNVPTLAISLEPKGGVPSAGGPTGPVLFKGVPIQTAL